MEEILHQAERLEKEYDWLGAVGSYEKVLNLLPEDDFSKMGEICERLGYASYRAAMQAESREEFKERMGRAIEACERAHEFCERLIDEQKTARMLRCEAVIKYLGYWLTAVPSEKRKLLDECLELANNALAAFRDSGNRLEFSRTYNELPLVFMFKAFLDRSIETGFTRFEKRPIDFFPNPDVQPFDRKAIFEDVEKPIKCNKFKNAL